MYIMIRLPAGTGLTAGGALLLTRYELRRRGRAAWACAEAEAFCGRSGTLLLVRPAPSVRIADYALPFIHKYFTD